MRPGLEKAILILATAVLLGWLSRYLLMWVSTRLVRRTRTALDDVIIEAINFPLRTFIFIAGLDLARRQFVMSVAWQTTLDRSFFVIYAVLGYIFLYRLISGIMRWYAREVMLKTATDLDDKFLDLFRRLTLTLLTLILIVIVLGEFGIEISALVTTLGIGSLALALAAQTTLGDMFAGFTIMIDQPFKVGDRIEIQDINTWGDVVEIGLRSTRILTRDNRMVSVPNSVIGKGLIVNYSDPNTKYRVETHVQVAYGTDIERARQVMIEAIQQQDWVMANERIEALFLQFGDSGLVFRVRCWIEHYVETRRILDKMNTVLYHALNEAGIEIPFPQRDLRVVEPVPVIQVSRSAS
ncbi:MAG: mechanosensitive ion channel family protein [Chloroflexi bacterium]|nr:MAG: mechanosensitive ion channel family protein [Chloroflexota bacterium]